MTALSSYSIGKVSVANGDTVIVGSDGADWSGNNAKSGDVIIVDGLPAVEVKDVADSSHLPLWAPWTGGDKSAVDYVIIQKSPSRFVGGDAMADVLRMISYLKIKGLFIIVGPDDDGPDRSLGEEDQFALQPATGRQWQKTAGEWVFKGVFKGINPRGEWEAEVNYSVADAVSKDGGSYLAIAPSTGEAPPNVTYWQVLAEGTAGIISVGTVTTGAPGSSVSVTNSGTASAAVLDFTIPRGNPGTGDMTATNNLSELPDKPKALSNLGGVSSGFVNKFRNGTMDIWQRGTSITPGVSTNDARYYADGWIVGFTASSAASITVSQAFSLGKAYYAMKITGATNVTGLTVKQRIEGLIAAPLRAQQVTVQARVFNSTGAAITPKLTVTTPTAQDNYASTATDIDAVNLQSCPNGAWTVVSYTFSANASAYNGQEITFDFGNNFGANTKYVQISEGDIRATPGIATGLNSAPPVPEMRPIFTELAFCRRYVYSSYPNGTTPGSPINGGAAGYFGLGAQSTSGGFAFFAITVLFGELRAAPGGNVTVYDNTGAAGKVSYFNGGWGNGGNALVNANGPSWANVGVNNVAGVYGLSFMVLATAEL